MCDHHKNKETSNCEFLFMLVSLVCRYDGKEKEGENIPIICGVTGLRNSLSRARFEYAFGSAREGIAAVCIDGEEGRRGEEEVKGAERCGWRYLRVVVKCKRGKEGSDGGVEVFE